MRSPLVYIHEVNFAALFAVEQFKDYFVTREHGAIGVYTGLPEIQKCQPCLRGLLTQGEFSGESTSKFITRLFTATLLQSMRVGLLSATGQVSNMPVSTYKW